MITQNRLKELLNYDPETGYFTRLMKRQKYQVGEIAGTINKQGYRIIELYGRAYYASKLAWFYMTGEWAENEIDHIDTNPGNDKWINLRKATHQENTQNRNGWGESRIKGVRAKGNRFEARIRVSGNLIYLGLYKTKEEALQVYNEAAQKFFKEFARIN